MIIFITGDPAIIGVACSIVSDITNGKYNVLKWDKQERKYYPIEINLYEKGEIDDEKDYLESSEKIAINFEKDQQDAMTKTEHIQSLADQVERLEKFIKSRIEKSEENLKDLKKEYQRISGEVIPNYDE